MNIEEFYGKLVSAYPDRQAIEDGIIVDISSLKINFHGLPVNRMTRAVWSEWEKFYNVQYDESGECLTPDFIPNLTQVLRDKMKLSDFDGRISKCPPNFWLVENEVQGWTMMYPEDY